jgi:uncharacterized membrane protein YfhO
MKKINLPAILGVVFLVVSVFLPYEISGGGIISPVYETTLLDNGSGYLFLLLAAIVLLFAILNKKIPIIICGVILFLFLLLLAYSFIQNNNGSMISYHTGIGFYLYLVGTLLVLLAVPLHKAISKKRG